MELAHLFAGGGAFGAVVAAAVMLPRAVRRSWRPARRLVAAVDTLVGRPARYPGDHEARPGITERLDRIDGRLDCLDGRLARVEQATTRRD